MGRPHFAFGNVRLGGRTPFPAASVTRGRDLSQGARPTSSVVPRGTCEPVAGQDESLLRAAALRWSDTPSFTPSIWVPPLQSLLGRRRSATSLSPANSEGSAFLGQL